MTSTAEPAPAQEVSLAPPAADPRRQAKFLYWMGWRLVDIAAFQGTSMQTLASWKSRDGWDEAPAIERMEGALEARFVCLITKDQKSGGDYKEIDLLGRQAERFARVRRFEMPGGHEGDLNPKVANRNAGEKKKARKNHFTDEQAAKLKAAFQRDLFGYQRAWWSCEHRTRVLLKSRQIGATWYFAREALIDAIETGRNQIFLSASKAQAHVFRQYIVAFAKAEAGVDLLGDPIIIDRGEGQEPATLYFLGTNARTAQGYHGNFYFDEFFWTFGFQALNKVASGMAMHKKWRKTYFSTPSSVTHEAYPFWTGELFNKRRPKNERQDIDTSWSALNGGELGPDRIWRQIVTIMDAERGGCDLFDLEELRLEYSPGDFENLLMCGFVDDTLSVFPMALMQKCMVDMDEAWPDFGWLNARFGRGRPFGTKEVWVGYDPNGGAEGAGGDSAGVVVVAPPEKAGGKFRVLERHQLRGMDFAAQAEFIRTITQRYRVTHIGIDISGGGQGVYQLVRQFFPSAVAITYSVEVKTRMVLKALNVITHGRLEFDAGCTDLAGSFMSIRRALTGSGRQLTYVAGRSEQTSHADLAWATMHALDNEPLEAALGGGVRRGSMEIYD